MLSVFFSRPKRLILKCWVSGHSPLARHRAKEEIVVALNRGYKTGTFIDYRCNTLYLILATCIHQDGPSTSHKTDPQSDADVGSPVTEISGSSPEDDPDLRNIDITLSMNVATVTRRKYRYDFSVIE
jgi:hypothetical protein